MLTVDLQSQQIGALVPEVDVAEGLDVDEKLLHRPQTHYSNLLLSSRSEDSGLSGRAKMEEKAMKNSMEMGGDINMQVIA